MDQKELNTLGANIRSWRKRANLTIGQLAELIGMDSGYLNFIELGSKTPSLPTLSKIAKGLGISLDTLFRNVPKGNDPDFQLTEQIRALFHGKSAAQKSQLIPVLKALRDPEKARAIQKLLAR